MDDKLRKRLIGAVVLMSLLVIFVPILIEKQNEMIGEIGVIPAEPDILPGLENIPMPDSYSRPEVLQEITPQIDVVDNTDVKDEPESVATPLDAWALQLASFSEKSRAQSLISKLRKHGYNCYQQQVKVAGKVRYRVKVGPEIERSSLVAMKPKLKKEFKLNGKIVRHTY